MAAVTFAILSAGGIGAGLVAIGPLLQNILEREGESGHGGLPGLAIDFNEKVPEWLSGIRISQATIDKLPPKPYTAVWVLMAGLGVLTIAGGTANFLHQYFSLSVVYKTLEELRRSTYRAVLRTPVLGPVSLNATDTVSRVVNDTAAVGTGLAVLLSKALSQISKGVIALIAAFIIEPKLTMITLVTAPILYTVIRKLAKRVRRASRTALEHQAKLYASATEALQGHRVVKISNAERYETGRFARINKLLTKELLKVRLARALSSPLFEMLTLLAVSLMSLIAAKAILDGEMKPEHFIGALIALGVAGASLRPVTGLVNEIQGSAAAAVRVKELLDAAPEPGLERALPMLARHAESISFEGVSFTYPGAQTPALRDINLTITAGQTVAIVGPNGSGKSTFLSLLPRLMEPTKGRVLIDGKDICQHRVRSLRRQIGVVTQETVLFEGTIADNIAYGSWGASDEAIKQAASRARADEFVRVLPEGYKSKIGERGSGLSGGQRQRLAIARAMLRDPAILLLDEATSMIDSKSEAAISVALREFSAGRTTLVVAHRLSTVINADRIVVLDHGKIIDTGTHAELLARCDLYRDLAEHQLLATDPPSTLSTEA